MYMSATGRLHRRPVAMEMETEMQTADTNPS